MPTNDVFPFAAAGDAFDWLRRTLGKNSFAELTAQAASRPPGAEGVLCMDWFNACRTPLMDGHLTGAFTGLKMSHGPAHLHRALLEASAFGVKWIVDLLQEHDVPVKGLTATGGLPHHNPETTKLAFDPPCAIGCSAPPATDRVTHPQAPPCRGLLLPVIGGAAVLAEEMLVAKDIGGR